MDIIPYAEVPENMERISADYYKQYRKDHKKEESKFNRLLRVKKKGDTILEFPSGNQLYAFKNYVQSYLNNRNSFMAIYEEAKKIDKDSRIYNSDREKNFVEYGLIGTDNVRKVSPGSLNIKEKLKCFVDISSIKLKILSNDFLYNLGVIATDYVLTGDVQNGAYTIGELDLLNLDNVIVNRESNANQVYNSTLLVEQNTIKLKTKIYCRKLGEENFAIYKHYFYGDITNFNYYCNDNLPDVPNQEEYIFSYKSITKCDFDGSYYIPYKNFMNEANGSIDFCFYIVYENNIYVCIVYKSIENNLKSYFFVVGGGNVFAREYYRQIKLQNPPGINIPIPDPEKPVFLNRLYRKEDIDVKFPYYKVDVSSTGDELGEKISHVRKIKKKDNFVKNLIIFKGKTTNILQTDILLKNSNLNNFASRYVLEYDSNIVLNNLNDENFVNSFTDGGWFFNNFSSFIVYYYLVLFKKKTDQLNMILLRQYLKEKMGFLFANKNNIKFFAKFYSMYTKFLKTFMSFHERSSEKKYIKMIINIFVVFYYIELIEKGIISRANIQNATTIAKLMNNKYLINFMNFDWIQTMNALELLLGVFISPNAVSEDQFRSIKNHFVKQYRDCVASIDNIPVVYGGDLLTQEVINGLKRIIVYVYDSIRNKDSLTKDELNKVLLRFDNIIKNLQNEIKMLNDMITDESNGISIIQTNSEGVLISGSSVSLKKREKIKK